MPSHIRYCRAIRRDHVLPDCSKHLDSLIAGLQVVEQHHQRLTYHPKAALARTTGYRGIVTGWHLGVPQYLQALSQSALQIQGTCFRCTNVLWYIPNQLAFPKFAEAAVPSQHPRNSHTAWKRDSYAEESAGAAATEPVCTSSTCRYGPNLDDPGSAVGSAK